MSARFQSRMQRWLLICILVFGALLLALTGMAWFGQDRWWFGAFLLYLPQWIWLLPLLPLTLLSLVAARRWLWLVFLYWIWVAGPIMGFCWTLHAPELGKGDIPVRILTCNAKWGMRDVQALMDEIRRDQPDLVLLQDADGMLGGPLGRFLKDWNVRSHEQYILASRLPMGQADIRWIPGDGGKGSCLRTQITVRDRLITVYDVHFESPRTGLNAFRATRRKPGYLSAAIDRLDENVNARIHQARMMQRFIRAEKGPILLTGDLNSTESSVALQMLQEVGLHDAFSEAGKGYGYTYGHLLARHRFPWLRFPWMRIDHILMSAQFQTRHCWAGTDEASDHRPVIADVILKP